MRKKNLRHDAEMVAQNFKNISSKVSQILKISMSESAETQKKEMKEERIGVIGGKEEGRRGGREEG